MYSSYFPLTYYFYPLLELELKVHPDQARFAEALNKKVDSGVETLLYVHIPYCQDMCRFCPFHVRVDKDLSVYERYTNALCLDILNTASTPRAQSSVINAIYFGGGSPSVLSPQQIAKILETIKVNFALADDDEELRTIFNIAATLQDIETLRKNSQEFKFDEVNVDMMYNLPGQNIHHVRQDVRRLLQDDFDSVDYYNLHYFAFPPKFVREMDEGKVPPKPSDDIMIALFEEIKTGMTSNGYKNVADQVYSKKDRVCEYFRLLWGGGFGDHSAETLAVGASARGYIDGFSYMKHGNVNKYMESIEANNDAIEKISSRLSKPENRGAVLFPKFLQIRKDSTLALETIPPMLINDWLKAGLLYEEHGSYLVSEKGKVWTNNMTVDLFEAAQREVGDRAVIALSNKAGARTGNF
jgi:oxygen-independent coproporphyrinogen-3 oxidase